MKRRILSAAALLMAAMLCFSACGGGAGESTEEQTAEITTEAATEKETEKETEIETEKETEPATETETETTEEQESETETAEPSTPEETTKGTEESATETEPASIPFPMPHVHEHKLEFVPGVYPKCQVTGHYEYYYCAECNRYFWEKTASQEILDFEELMIPALLHELVLIPEKASTCTEAGHAPYYECKLCHAWFWDKDGISPIAHAQEISYYPLGHYMIHVNSAYPGCEEPGTIEHYRCGLCGRLFWDGAGQYPIANKNEVVLEPYGHDWSPWALHPESQNMYVRYCYNDPSHKETMIK